MKELVLTIARLDPLTRTENTRKQKEYLQKKANSRLLASLVDLR